MLVKKFEAENMAAALKQVKDTLGSDALILSTRTIGKRGLGVLGRQMIEVTAAVESAATKNSLRQALPDTNVKKNNFGKYSEGYGQRVETLEDEEVTISRQARQNQAVEVAENPLEAEVRQLRAQLEAQNVGQLQAEITELKKMMQQFAQPQPQPSVPAPALQESPSEEIVQTPAKVKQPAVAASRLRTPAEQSLDDLIDMLIERGIDEEAAGTIARFTAPQMNTRQRLDRQACREFLTTTLASLVQTTGPLWQPGEPQKRVSLIGATGVGKTTTIAKLAAEAMQSGARVALVTIDTYRIAAVEQLKVYGDIMGLPVEVVLSPEQLQDAFRRHRDKDLILIDTAGRSPKDHMRIEELNEFLGQGADVENCLVLAATTDEKLQQRTLDAFAQLPLSRLVFTKLDETDRCGALINLPTSSNLPLAYLTNGQKVPEDLLLADARKVAEMVMETAPESRRIAV